MAVNDRAPTRTAHRQAQDHGQPVPDAAAHSRAAQGLRSVSN